jgi:hypothetical protein
MLLLLFVSLFFLYRRMRGRLCDVLGLCVVWSDKDEAHRPCFFAAMVFGFCVFNYLLFHLHYSNLFLSFHDSAALIYIYIHYESNLSFLFFSFDK